MTKKILSLAVVAMLLVAIVVIPASAEEVSVQPRATCSYCGGYTTVKYTKWTNIAYIGEVRCNHGLLGNDDLYTQKRTATYTCSGCSYGDYTSEQRREHRVCNGYPET